jgi:hypothetical protein
MKSVLVPGTALFMMWTTDDVKLHPSTVFQGNVRIASLQGSAAGYHVFVFKDNVGRKVRSQDMEKIVAVSNNILASRQGVHQAAKAAAINETLCDELLCDSVDASDEEGGNSDEDEGGESSDFSEDEVGLTKQGENGAQQNGKEQQSRTSVPVAHVAADVDNAIGVVASGTLGGIPLGSVTPAGEGPVIPDGENPIGDMASGTPGIVPSGEPADEEVGKLTVDDTETTTTTTTVANEKEDLGRHVSLNLTNPPPPPGSEVHQVASSLPDTIRELREMEALLKDKKKWYAP